MEISTTFTGTENNHTENKITKVKQNGFSHNVAQYDETTYILHNSEDRVSNTVDKSTYTTDNSEMIKHGKITPRGRMVIVAMCAVQFIAFMNFSIIAPIFPPAAIKKGMSLTIVGFVIGSYNLTVFFTSPIFGLVISRVGAKFIFVSGTFVCAVCGILFGMVDYGPGGGSYIALCFATRCIQAVGCSAFQTAAYTIIANQFPERVTTFFSIFETMCGLGMMVGPPIGGFLYQIGGYFLPFVLTGGILLIIGVIVLILTPSMTVTYIPKSNSLFYYLRHPGTLLLVFTISVMSFSVTFLEPTFATFLISFKLEVYQVGLMFLIMPALYGILGPMYGTIADKKGYLMTMMIAGAFTNAIGYFLIAPPTFTHIPGSLWLCIVGNIVYGLAVGTAFVPVFPALITTALEAGYADNFDTSGMVSGIMLSAYAIGGFAGATSAGVMVESMGFSSSVFVVSMMFLFNCFLLILYAIYKRRMSKGGDTFDRRSAAVVH